MFVIVDKPPQDVATDVLQSTTELSAVDAELPAEARDSQLEREGSECEVKEVAPTYVAHESSELDCDSARAIPLTPFSHTRSPIGTT